MLMSCDGVSDKEYRIETEGPEVVDFGVLPFDLTQVKLLEGRFNHATELNKKILLDYDPDRFLATFRMEAGLEPKAEHYGGWEDYPRRNLNGHSLGHYMTALALMYRTSGEQEFLDRLNYIIDELKICQEADGDGYIGALPGAKKVFEEEVAKGDIRSAGFDLNGYWAPFYIMHKILAGLNDAYIYFGNEKALEISGNEQYKETARFFWDRVVHHHSYVTGGHGFEEYFAEPDQLSDRLGPGTTETCNVYNMLKLSRHLFTWKPTAEVADFYERALFNHMHSSQHPETGHVIYNLSLEMGGFKSYQDPAYFTCCVGTGMENHSKYARNIFYHNNKELYISQYIASGLNWEEKGLDMLMMTRFPDEQGATLEFRNEEPVEMIMQIRYPSWAEEGIEIKVNGRPNTFIMSDVGQPRDVVMKPFFATHNRRYSIFWDIFTEEEWKNKQEEYRLKEEKRKELEQMTVDYAQPGEMQPERNHNFKDNDSRVVRFRGRAGRQSRGSFQTGAAVLLY